jgi:acyl dehydratase
VTVLRDSEKTLFDEWFDDLPLRASFRTGAVSVSAEDVQVFADLTGDHHPLHVDREYAARSIYGRNIAHGMLVVSRGLGLVPVNPERSLVLRRSTSLFKRPVFVDQEFYCSGLVSSKNPIDDHFGLVTFSLKLLVLPMEGPRDKGRARLAVRGQLEGVWARTPAALEGFELSRLGLGL